MLSKILQKNVDFQEIQKVLKRKSAERACMSKTIFFFCLAYYYETVTLSRNRFTY